MTGAINPGELLARYAGAPPPPTVPPTPERLPVWEVRCEACTLVAAETEGEAIAKFAEHWDDRGVWDLMPTARQVGDIGPDDDEPDVMR